MLVCRHSRTITLDMSFTNFCRSYSCSSVGKSRDLNAGAVDAFVTSDYQQCFGCSGSVSNSLHHWLQSDHSFHSSTSFLTRFLTVTHFFWHSDFNSSALNYFFLIFSISASFNYSCDISISMSFLLSTPPQHPVIYSVLL